MSFKPVVPRGPRRIEPAAQSRHRWATLLLALLVGCSTNEPSFERVPIEGSVMLDDKPLESGTIRFVPTAGALGPKITLMIQEGRFQADCEAGPSEGTHRVEIELTEGNEYAHDDEQALERLKTERVSRINRKQLPAIYNDSSTLTATIKKGSMQNLEFALSSKP